VLGGWGLPRGSPLRRGESAVAALLLLASLVCVALVLARVVLSHTHHYGYLVFNLAVAWSPFVLAVAAYALSQSKKRVAYLLVVPTGVAWLLFFPNALYLLTEFVHLAQWRDNMPVWYDVMLISWFACVGLVLGIGSLLLMQEIAARAWGRPLSWLAVVGATLLGGVGIYLGRFLRWSSWDVFGSPFSMTRTVLARVTRPAADMRVFAFAALYALLFLFAYTAVYLLAAALRKAESGAE
jgi:uncharacterized membrane protein